MRGLAIPNLAAVRWRRRRRSDSACSRQTEIDKSLDDYNVWHCRLDGMWSCECKGCKCQNLRGVRVRSLCRLGHGNRLIFTLA